MNPPPKSWKHPKGFTLAELLISLAILGVIATFTIPKIIQAHEYQAYNAKAKEAIAMVSAAYNAYKIQNGVNASTSFSNLRPYSNYVKLESSGTKLIDEKYSLAGTSAACNNNNPCLILHSGAILRYKELDGTFGGTNTTNAVWFQIDPTGQFDGNGDLVMLFLFYDGRITDYSNIPANTVTAANTYQPDPATIPPWFSW